MTGRRKHVTNLAAGLGFLAPNILGFLAFTLVPLVFSLVLAFSNWDLRLHNQYARARDPNLHIQQVGLKNFTRLLAEPDFWKFLGNTLFFMIGLPLGIAASLLAALLLSKDLRGGSGRTWAWLLASAGLVAGCLMLAAAGAGGTGMTLLMAALAGSILLAGVLGGTTVYRTLFYLPSFTSGVATMLLWKKLFNPQSGPINTALTPPLELLGRFVHAAPAHVIQLGSWTCWIALVAVILLGFRKLRRLWEEGDAGVIAAVLSAGLLVLPVVIAVERDWFPNTVVAFVVGSATAVALLVELVRAGRSDRTFTARSPLQGLDGAAMLAASLATGTFVLFGLAAACWTLFARAAAGTLEPPAWLNDYAWAKPSLMIMGFWASIGSNTMLLYIAALTNVPGELYEAADLDGASAIQRFWNVTWPQLAPTTFFCVVMGVIGGLQGGFDQARVMTMGGPAGSTTTLSYFVYTEGFETGRLGYSSAVAWTLFMLVLLLTMINWTLGSRYVND